MLAELAIRDVAIIDRVELTFDHGLTVMTGETGAGKSIAVDALALVLGGRASSDLIRSGAERAEVTARFEIAPESSAAAWLRQQDLFGEGECIIRRTLDAKGSRAFINGRPQPLQLLKELGEHLVELHGQHEHQLLLRTPEQRRLLDAYAGATDEALALAADFRALEELRRRQQALHEAQANGTARRALLEHELEELRALGLGREDILQLEDRHKRLAHTAEVDEGLREACTRLGDDEGALTQIALAIQRLQGLVPYDRRLLGLAERLQTAAIEVEDVVRELRDAAEQGDLDPGELARLETQIAQIDRLARKHRLPGAELPALRERLEQDLSLVSGNDTQIQELTEQIVALEAQAKARAIRLTKARQQGATTLATEVTARLPALGMGGARFAVHLEPLGTLAAQGFEQVEFQVSTNPGQPLKPLARIASGGELSRLSLALQVALARIASVPTLIFDEVDVGIGGAVAEIVGRELKTLGHDRQVLCITHLPQVAAHGRHHYRVQKRTRRGSMATVIDALSGAPRVQELARMLGGVDESPQTVALAEDMLRRVQS